MLSLDKINIGVNVHKTKGNLTLYATTRVTSRKQ